MEVRMSRFLVLPLALLLSASLTWAQGPRSIPVVGTAPNEPTVGTQLNYLAKFVSPSSGTLAQLRKPLVTDTSERLVVVHANAGITGSAVYTSVGEVNCVMDATNASGVGGKPVLMSTTTAGQCHAQTAALPTSVMIIGYMKSDVTTSGQPALIDVLNQPIGPGGSFTGVTNVGLTVPAPFTVAPATPPGISTSGTFAISMPSQTANTFYAGPTSGGAAAPAFRALNAADVAALGLTGSCGTTAVSDLVGTYPNCTVFRASNAMNMTQEVGLTGVISPSFSSSTTVNDYSPTNWTTASRVLVSSTGANSIITITGLAARGNGDMKKLCNVSTNGTTIVLKNKNSGSTSGNQLILSPNPASAAEQDDVTIPQGLCMELWYSNTSPVGWRLDAGTVPDMFKIRPIGMIVGDPDTNGPVLVDANDTPQGFSNHYGRDLKVLSLACYADAGSPTIQVTWNSVTETGTSVLSADCTCGTATFNACTLSGTASNLLIHSYASASGSRTCTTAPCGLSFWIRTAGGTSRYIVVDGKAILQ